MRLRFPHPLALLLGCVLVAAALTWVLPAGTYERRDDPATGRKVVVPGTYHTVARTPVGPFQALVAVPKGLTDAASVVFVVFLVGAAFVVVDRTGALRGGAAWLVGRLDRGSGGSSGGSPGGGGALLIPVVSVAFALGGVLIGLQEEVVGLVPVLLVVARGLGYDATTAVAMSLGAAVLGGAFSPVNPFGVGVAQKLAELPLVSGWELRSVALLAALALWIAGTMRHARRVRVAPTAAAAGDAIDAEIAASAGPFGPRQAAVLLLLLGGFAAYVVGALRYDWGFDELSALFLLLGILAGLAGGLRVAGTADAFAQGFREMAGAALLIGVARSIYVVLEQGQVVDTIVRAMLAPLDGLPPAVTALGMLAVQTAVHVPVPSTSGQAVLTVPIVVPLADLIGLSRQAAVLAYQYGAGLCDLVTPTNGALMAVLAAAGVKYDDWLRFVVPLFLGAMVVGAGVGVAIGVR
jgi:uncharacterized ion transporter superfamily protein YfcC